MSQWSFAARTAAAVVALLSAARADAVQGNFGYFEGVHTFEFAEDYSGDPECRPGPGMIMSFFMHDLSYHPNGPKILTGADDHGDATLSAQETMLYIPEERACTGSISISVTRQAKITFDGAKTNKTGPIGIFNDTHVILQPLPGYGTSLSNAAGAMTLKLLATWADDNQRQHQ